MFTHKDIEYRSIFIINCLEKKNLKVKTGELFLEDGTSGKTLTKFPFQKILALFIVGNFTITSPLIEKCRQHGIFICVTKLSLRPVFTFGVNAEANFLLREKQFAHDINDLKIPLTIVRNKIHNQIKLLHNTRKKDEITTTAILCCQQILDRLNQVHDFHELMGLEGAAAKAFFQAYYQDFEWKQRQPRTKCDFLNVILDIGYTILFNFIELFLRLFGFDLYIGVYHRTWFKRKSLVCDLMEPFRCIIDKQVRKSLNINQFSPNDFELHKNEFRLIRNKSIDYYVIFFNALVPYKQNIFIYIQQYYRTFMSSNLNNLPSFNI